MQQALDVLKMGVGAITLPVDVAEQMFAHPAVPAAVDRFSDDWRRVFGNLHSFES